MSQASVGVLTNVCILGVSGISGNDRQMDDGDCFDYFRSK